MMQQNLHIEPGEAGTYCGNNNIMAEVRKAVVSPQDMNLSFGSVVVAIVNI